MTGGNKTVTYLRVTYGMTGQLCALAGWLTLALTGTAPALAQSTFASLVGTVHDASGAVVANCAISVENSGTDARRSTLTDSTGTYNVPNLEPGDYTIRM
jgi:hypothetical protein